MKKSTGPLASRCAGCGAPIVWRRTAADRWTPVDLDGQPHWSTCPKAAQFRRLARMRLHRERAATSAGRQLPLLLRLVDVHDDDDQGVPSVTGPL